MFDRIFMKKTNDLKSMVHRELDFI